MCILYTSIFSYKKKKQVEKDLLSEYGEGGQIKNKRKRAAAASSRMILLKGSRVHSNNQWKLKDDIWKWKGKKEGTIGCQVKKSF